jgi:hypothetical protein
MTRQFNEGFKKHNSNNERPIYINFAASKMSNAVKPNTVVEFTDFMGRKHKVACRHNGDMKKAMTFFAVLKKESARINDIIASFPMSYGRIPKKFIAEAKRDLKAIGLSAKAIELVLC